MAILVKLLRSFVSKDTDYVVEEEIVGEAFLAHDSGKDLLEQSMVSWPVILYQHQQMTHTLVCRRVRLQGLILQRNNYNFKVAVNYLWSPGCRFTKV